MLSDFRTFFLGLVLVGTVVGWFDLAEMAVQSIVRKYQAARQMVYQESPPTKIDAEDVAHQIAKHFSFENPKTGEVWEATPIQK